MPLWIPITVNARVDSSLILKSVNSQLWAGDLKTEPAAEREGPTSSKWVGGSYHTICQMYKCQNQEKTQELDSSQQHTEILNDF